MFKYTLKTMVRRLYGNTVIIYHRIRLYLLTKALTAGKTNITEVTLIQNFHGLTRIFS